MLKAMVEAAGPDPSLTEVRLLTVCLVAFAGFLRCNELIKLKCCDITFNAEGMVVNVESSKTD
jgi:integrase